MTKAKAFVPLTVRLTRKTERALAVLARRGQTRSDVVREAIERYAAATEADAGRPRPYDEWVDVLGVVRTGGRPPGLTTGDAFREIVRRKARARRSR